MSAQTERTIPGSMGLRTPSGDVITGAAIITVTTTSAATAEQVQKDATWVIAKPISMRKRSLSPVKERPATQRHKRAMPEQYGEQMYAYHQERRTKKKEASADPELKAQKQTSAELEEDYVVVSSDEFKEDTATDNTEVEGFVVVPENPPASSPQAQLFRRFAARFM